MEQNILYIDKALQLSKADYFSPFLVEWTPLYATERQLAYLANDYQKAGTKWQEIQVLAAGPRLQSLLDLLFPSIPGYPYSWPLAGEKLDLLGFDFELQQNGAIFEIGLVASEEAWRRLNLVEPDAPIQKVYEQPETVSGAHLTKCSLVLEKTSPLSLLSFRMQSVFPVRLASLLYESDLSGYNEAQKVNLETLQVQQSAENITILFGQPIFAKRLTFVLAQDNAKTNTYYRSGTAEDFTYAATETDRTLMEQLLEEDGETTVYMTQTIYTDEEIKDWSASRKQAYLAWRTKVLEERK